MRDSYASSRDLYEVTLPELDSLAEAAWSSPGCYGARLAGGGFGGCIQALVEAGSIEEVEARVREEFSRRYGSEPLIFASTIADGTRYVDRSGATIGPPEIE